MPRASKQTMDDELNLGDNKGKPGPKRFATVRVAPDLAKKLAAIYAIDGINAARLLDPVVRTYIEKRYAEAIRKAAEELGRSK